MIQFSGTAEQVEAAFHTSMRYYRVDGELRYANSTNPLVPEALGDMVLGIAGLHNFPARSDLRRNDPQTLSTGSHFLSPGAFETIYDVVPVLNYLNPTLFVYPQAV